MSFPLDGNLSIFDIYWGKSGLFVVFYASQHLGYNVKVTFILDLFFFSEVFLFFLVLASQILGLDAPEIWERTQFSFCRILRSQLQGIKILIGGFL